MCRLFKFNFTQAAWQAHSHGEELQVNLNCNCPASPPMIPTIVCTGIIFETWSCLGSAWVTWTVLVGPWLGRRVRRSWLGGLGTVKLEFRSAGEYADWHRPPRHWNWQSKSTRTLTRSPGSGGHHGHGHGHGDKWQLELQAKRHHDTVTVTYGKGGMICWSSLQATTAQLLPQPLNVASPS